LAIVVNLLSEIEINFDSSTDTLPFVIDNKISYNGLDYAKIIINDYYPYTTYLETVYNQFDQEGSNKSTSVIQSIRDTYAEIKSEDKDNLFYHIISVVKEKVVNSRNFNQIRIEELDICVRIIVVDAFIKCKIFDKPPTNIHHATT